MHQTCAEDQDRRSRGCKATMKRDCNSNMCDGVGCPCVINYPGLVVANPYGLLFARQGQVSVDKLKDRIHTVWAIRNCNQFWNLSFHCRKVPRRCSTCLPWYITKTQLKHDVPAWRIGSAYSVMSYRPWWICRTVRSCRIGMIVPDDRHDTTAIHNTSVYKVGTWSTLIRH